MSAELSRRRVLQSASLGAAALAVGPLVLPKVLEGLEASVLPIPIESAPAEAGALHYVLSFDPLSYKAAYLQTLYCEGEVVSRHEITQEDFVGNNALWRTINFKEPIDMASGDTLTVYYPPVTIE